MQRAYFYQIDQYGGLHHEGVIQDDADFLTFFLQRLQCNDSGRHTNYPYLSRCGSEMNFVQSAGAPIILRRLENGLLHYSHGRIAIDFDVRMLSVDPHGNLLHCVGAGLQGRIAGPALQDLAECIRSSGDGYLMRWQGEERLLPAAPPYPLQGPEPAAAPIST
ncbi:MAG: DUF4505 family protein [Leptospirales bacterium]|nr:DUF4505 family protein [Leptospirales bacterium]